MTKLINGTGGLAPEASEVCARLQRVEEIVATEPKVVWIAPPGRTFVIDPKVHRKDTHFMWDTIPLDINEGQAPHFIELPSLDEVSIGTTYTITRTSHFDSDHTLLVSNADANTYILPSDFAGVFDRFSQSVTVRAVGNFAARTNPPPNRYWYVVSSFGGSVVPPGGGG